MDLFDQPRCHRARTGIIGTGFGRGTEGGRGSNSVTPFQVLLFLAVLLVFWVYGEDYLELGEVF